MKIASHQEDDSYQLQLMGIGDASIKFNKERGWLSVREACKAQPAKEIQRDRAAHVAEFSNNRLHRFTDRCLVKRGQLPIAYHDPAVDDDTARAAPARDEQRQPLNNQPPVIEGPRSLGVSFGARRRDTSSARV
jgi:hypothetical protein